ncbi:MAG TPA: DUF4132 domain-containing protein [Herpetosiphonaceae bacterium]
MSTREFHYQDDTSSKFWRITLLKDSYTVQFGRIGTEGQIQTKTFADEKSAQAASDKQIAEKLKKGYREVTVANGDSQSAGATSIPALVSNLAAAVLGKIKPGAPTRATPAPQPTVNAQPTPTAATQSTLSAPTRRVKPEPEPVIPIVYDPSLRLNLEPIDWFWATWRNPAPLERPTAAPFDQAEGLRRLRRLSSSEYEWNWKWENAIPEFVTADEAIFWLHALHLMNEHRERGSAHGRINSAQLADRVATSDPNARQLREQAFAIVLGLQHRTQPIMMTLLVPLFSPQEIMARLIEVFEEQQAAAQVSWYRNPVLSLVEGFRRSVLPYLSQREREQLSQTLTPYFGRVHWPNIAHESSHPAFFFAAMLGGHTSTLRRIVQSWPDDNYRATPWSDSYQRPQEIIFGLDDPREVESQLRRLQLRLNQPAYIRAWLAHTEDRALDVVSATIQETTEREAAAALLRSFALIAAPAAAPHMLMLSQESKAPMVASAWIDAHSSHTIAGLLPLADSRGAQAEAATEILHRLVRRGYGDLIEQALAALPGEQSARLRANIIEDAQPSLDAFDDQTTPDWLAEALRSPVKSKGQPPAWVQVLDLPPIVIGQHVLSTEQVAGLLQAVQQGKNGAEHPLIRGVKQHADSASLDHFAWSLFERWLAEGAPSKENWAFFGLGLLGGDNIALKLAPLIRVWPGQSQHQRAVNGLECLRMIGSDTALMQINSIAQKVKFKGLQVRAVECMEQIAQERGMSRAQLEDRIVPDCELDARGQRIFDYGPRQFRFVLGPEMKPMVRDGQGKLKPNLPPPTTKDDAEQAEQALAEWKLLKKQVAEVAKVQAVRLEQVMVTGRRWTLTEFETLLVRHPLMTHLVRTLIWGTYDPLGALSSTFRVTEDQSYADATDEMVDLPPDVAIGLIHPLDLSADVRAAWGEILSDYEIVQPFPQLGRAIQRLEAHELTATDIMRFNELTIPAAALVFGLDKLGWTRDLPADAGVFAGHFKPFYGPNLTAVIQYEDGVAPGWIVDAPDQKIRYVTFVSGILEAEYWPSHKDRLVLGDVDPVVISEVLNDMLSIAAKAK